MMSNQQPKASHSVSTILNTFSQTSTIHSLSKYTSNVSIKRKILWAALFLASLGYLIYQFTGLVELYLSHPIRVVNSWKVYNKLEFPAVTICNLNNLKKSQLERMGFYEEMHKIYNRSSQLTSDNQDDMEEKLQRFTSQLGLNELREMGHQPDEFIVSCYFKGVSCRKKFRQFYSRSLGNCYTFNSMYNNHTHHSTKVGESQALALVLNVEASEYVGMISHEVGVVALVHDPGVAPFPNTEGLTIPTGFKTNVAFTKGLSSRLSKPYSKSGCKDPGATIKYNGKTFKYSVEGCLSECFLNTSLELCRCAPTEYNHPLSCDPFNQTHRDCIEKVNNNLDENLRSCNCLAPCNETSYAITTSSAVWPSQAFWEYFKMDLENSSHLSYASNIAAARENFVCVSFFYSSFRTKAVIDFKAYEFGSLVGDMGGQLGLFVGMSVLSLVEVFELIFDVLAMFLGRRQTQRINVQHDPKS